MRNGAAVIPVCPVGDLPDGAVVRVLADVPVSVFATGGELFAVDDTCTHQDASLADGWVEDCTVECPLHASAFDLRTGEPTGPPARRPLRTHRVVVEDGTVYLRLGTAAHDDSHDDADRRTA